MCVNDVSVWGTRLNVTYKKKALVNFKVGLLHSIVESQ